MTVFDVASADPSKQRQSVYRTKTYPQKRATSRNIDHEIYSVSMSGVVDTIHCESRPVLIDSHRNDMNQPNKCVTAKIFNVLLCFDDEDEDDLK